MCIRSSTLDGLHVIRSRSLFVRARTSRMLLIEDLAVHKPTGTGIDSVYLHMCFSSRKKLQFKRAWSASALSLTREFSYFSHFLCL